VRQYLDFLRHIRQSGARKEDRTGTGTLSVFGYQMRFDLAAGFPLVTTKKLHVRSIIHELLWFLKGDTNIAYLRDNAVTIWDEWADENGDLGPVYGKQWRRWATADGREIDQLSRIVEQLKANPDSRKPPNGMCTSQPEVGRLPDSWPTPATPVKRCASDRLPMKVAAERPSRERPRLRHSGPAGRQPVGGGPPSATGRQ